VSGIGIEILDLTYRKPVFYDVYLDGQVEENRKGG
jgi:hypothetical protein